MNWLKVILILVGIVAAIGLLVISGFVVMFKQYFSNEPSPEELEHFTVDGEPRDQVFPTTHQNDPS